MNTSNCKAFSPSGLPHMHAHTFTHLMLTHAQPLRTFACIHSYVCTHAHPVTRVCMHRCTVLSRKANKLVTFPSSDASGRKRAFYACLLSFPTAKTHEKRPNPLPIFLLVVPPEMRPDPEKAIGGRDCLEPASWPAASAPGEGARERRQAAFM